MTTLLRCTGMSAGYDGNPVVRDLCLEVRRGQVVALIGPNGAGKTTTLLALAGELRPLAGEVELFGQRTTRPLHLRARKGLGYVPESRAIIGPLTVRQNMIVSGCDAAIALNYFPELERLLGRRAGLLSGGEQQMLSIAQALARKPAVLMIDEMSLGLAPLIVERLMDAVRRAADDGIGVLLVEQHVHHALKVADFVYVLAQGMVTRSGNSHDLRGSLTALTEAYLATPVTR